MTNTLKRLKLFACLNIASIFFTMIAPLGTLVPTAYADSSNVSFAQLLGGNDALVMMPVEDLTDPEDWTYTLLDAEDTPIDTVVGTSAGIEDIIDLGATQPGPPPGHNWVISFPTESPALGHSLRIDNTGNGGDPIDFELVGRGDGISLNGVSIIDPVDAPYAVFLDLEAASTAPNDTWTYELLNAWGQPYGTPETPAFSASIDGESPGADSDANGVVEYSLVDPTATLNGSWVVTFDSVQPEQYNNYLKINTGSEIHYILLDTLAGEGGGDNPPPDGILSLSPLPGDDLEGGSGYAGAAVLTIGSSTNFPGLNPLDWSYVLLDAIGGPLVNNVRINTYCDSAGVTAAAKSALPCPLPGDGNRVYVIEFSDSVPDLTNEIEMTDLAEYTWSQGITSADPPVDPPAPSSNPFPAGIKDVQLYKAFRNALLVVLDPASAVDPSWVYEVLDSAEMSYDPQLLFDAIEEGDALYDLLGADADGIVDASLHSMFEDPAGTDWFINFAEDAVITIDDLLSIDSNVMPIWWAPQDSGVNGIESFFVIPDSVYPNSIGIMNSDADMSEWSFVLRDPNGADPVAGQGDSPTPVDYSTLGADWFDDDYDVDDPVLYVLTFDVQPATNNKLSVDGTVVDLSQNVWGATLTDDQGNLEITLEQYVEDSNQATVDWSYSLYNGTRESLIEGGGVATPSGGDYPEYDIEFTAEVEQYQFLQVADGNVNKFYRLNIGEDDGPGGGGGGGDCVYEFCTSFVYTEPMGWPNLNTFYVSLGGTASDGISMETQSTSYASAMNPYNYSFSYYEGQTRVDRWGQGISGITLSGEDGGVYKQIGINTDFAFRESGVDLVFNSNIVSSNSYPMDGGSEVSHDIVWSGASEVGSFEMSKIEPYTHQTGDYLRLYFTDSFDNTESDLDNIAFSLCNASYTDCSIDLTADISTVTPDSATLEIFFDDYVSVTSSQNPNNIYPYTGYAKIDFSGLVGGSLCSANAPADCLTELLLSDTSDPGNGFYYRDEVNFNWDNNYTVEIGSGPYVDGGDLLISLSPFEGGSGAFGPGSTLYIGTEADLDASGNSTTVDISFENATDGFVEVPMSGGWYTPDTTYYARVLKANSGSEGDRQAWSNSIEIAPADIEIAFNDTDTFAEGYADPVQIDVISGDSHCTTGFDCELRVVPGIVTEIPGDFAGDVPHFAGDVTIDVSGYAVGKYSIFVNDPDGFESNILYLSIVAASSAPTASFSNIDSTVATYNQTQTAGLIQVYGGNCGVGACNYYEYNTPEVSSSFYSNSNNDGAFDVSGWETGDHYIKVYNNDFSESSEVLVAHIYEDLVINFSGDPEALYVGDSVEIDVAQQIGTNCQSPGCDYYLSDSPGATGLNNLASALLSTGTAHSFDTTAEGLAAGKYYVKVYDPTALEWSNELEFTLQAGQGGGLTPAATFDFNLGPQLVDNVLVGDTVSVYLYDGDCSLGCDFSVIEDGQGEVINEPAVTTLPWTFDSTIIGDGAFTINVTHNSGPLTPLSLTVDPAGGGGAMGDWSVPTDDDHIYTIVPDVSAWAEYLRDGYCIAAAFDESDSPDGMFDGDNIVAFAFSDNLDGPFTAFAPHTAEPYVAIMVVAFDKPAQGCEFEYIVSDPVKYGRYNAGNFSSNSGDGPTTVRVSVSTDFGDGGGGTPVATFDSGGGSQATDTVNLGDPTSVYLNNGDCSGTCSYLVTDTSTMLEVGPAGGTTTTLPFTIDSTLLGLGEFSILVNHPEEGLLGALTLTVVGDEMSAITFEDRTTEKTVTWSPTDTIGGRISRECSLGNGCSIYINDEETVDSSNYYHSFDNSAAPTFNINPSYLRQGTSYVVAVHNDTLKVSTNTLELDVISAFTGLANVFLSDLDFVEPGISGHDFTISWDPVVAVADGYTFDEFEVYLFDISTWTDDEPTHYNFERLAAFSNMSKNTYVVAPHIMQDSGDGLSAAPGEYNRQELDENGQYVACVHAKVVGYDALEENGASPNLMQCGNTDEQTEALAPMSPNAEVIEDEEAPWIMHFFSDHAVIGQDAYLYGLYRDDQTEALDVADTGDGGVESFNLYYRAIGGSSYSAATVNYIEGDLFEFVVPSSVVNPGFEYYLAAIDSDGNESAFCEYADVSSGSCANNPFDISGISAGALTVSGNVTALGSEDTIDEGYIIASGYAVQAQTVSSGAYGFNNIPSNFNLEMTFYADGYCETRRGETTQTSSILDADLEARSGTCLGGAAVFIDDSWPRMGMDDFPVDSPIVLSMSVPLDEHSVVNNDATDPNSQIFLEDSEGNKVDGEIAYCQDDESMSGQSHLCDIDRGYSNAIVFVPSSDLEGDRTYYEFTIRGGVIGMNGHPIQGTSDTGIGHKLFFWTADADKSEYVELCGTTNEYQPPHIINGGYYPGNGDFVHSGIKPTIHFNKSINEGTLNSDTVKLFSYESGAFVNIGIELGESNDFIRIVPDAALTPGTEYRIELRGGITGLDGMPVSCLTDSSNTSFESVFNIHSSTQGITTDFPEIEAPYDDGATDVSVGVSLVFNVHGGQLDADTVDEKSVIFKQGPTQLGAEVFYEESSGKIFVDPSIAMLTSGRNYSVTFNTRLADLNGNTLDENLVLSFRTSSDMDNTAPKIMPSHSWCHTDACFVMFNELVVEAAFSDDPRYATSILNIDNYTLEIETAPGSEVFEEYSIPTSATVHSSVYDPGFYSLEGLGLAATDIDRKFILTVDSVSDLYGNEVNPNADSFMGQFEDPYQDDSDDDNHDGTTGGGGGEGHYLGDIIQPIPSNPYAGEGMGTYFQMYLHMSQLGTTIQDGDQLRFTFPLSPGNPRESADLTNAIPDWPSPYFHDFAPASDVRIGFEEDNEIEVDTELNQITVNLDVEGGEITSDALLYIDLRDIVNPEATHEYTVFVEHIRDGQLMTPRAVESEPYDVSRNDGANSIEVEIFAGGSGSGTIGADGDLDFNMKPENHFMHYFDFVELEDGEISAVNGMAATSILYENLPDGCYSMDIWNYIDLGSELEREQYIAEDATQGRGTHRNRCLYGGESITEEYVYLPVNGDIGVDVAELTVVIDRATAFRSAPLDIIVSPPYGPPIVHTLDAVTTPDPDGYSISIPVTSYAVGGWDVELAPGFVDERNPRPAWNLFDAVVANRAPIEINSDGEIESSQDDSTNSWSGDCSAVGYYSFDDDTDTLTLAADPGEIEIPVEIVNSAGDTVESSGIEIFAHGRCSHTAAITNSSGDASIKVSSFGSYKIDVNYEGFYNGRDIKVVKDPNGDVEGVYFAGRKVVSYTDGVPTGSVKIPLDVDGTIVSGEIRNAQGNKIVGTSFIVKAHETTTGMWFDKHGQQNNGTWSMILPFDGEWEIKLKPSGGSNSDVCGVFERTIHVDGETSIPNQHIQVDSGDTTCRRVSGTVDVPGTTVNHGHVFAEQVHPSTYEWLEDGYRIDAPLDDGEFNTYLLDGTYRIGFYTDFHYEEILVVDQDFTGITLSPGEMGSVTFEFVGGSAATQGFVNLNDEGMYYDNHIPSTANNYVMSVPDGTYDYFLDIHCLGQFEGIVSTGDTVTIDISGAQMVNLSGTVYDDDGDPLDETFVNIHDFTQNVHCGAQTDSDGNYRMSVRQGTFEVNAFKERFIMNDSTVTPLTLLADNMSYDFGGSDAAPRAGLVETDRLITVSVFHDDGTTPIYNAGVNATTNGFMQPGIPNDDGTYIVYALDGTWDIEVFAPGYLPLEGEDAAQVTVDGSDESVSITMPDGFEDLTRISTTHTETFDAVTGKSIDKMDEMGMGVKLEAGFMTEDGVITISRDFAAKKTLSDEPVCDLSYDISIVTDDGSPQREFLKPITITLEYDPTCITSQLLPYLSGKYFDESTASWQLPDGFSVDDESNTISLYTTHLTEFAVVTPPAESEEDEGEEVDPTPVVDTPGGGGGGGGSTSAKSLTTEVTSIAAVVVEDEYEIPEDGLVEDEVTVQNTDTDAFITIAAGTTVTDEDGDEYEGNVLPPVVVDMDVTVPANKYSLVSDVFEVGSATVKLFFDKKIAVVVPIDSNINPNSHLVAYSYNEEDGVWEYETDGDIKVMNGEYVFEFEVDHLTKFSVFNDTSVKTSIFDDITTHWAKTYIEFLYSKGIISGYSDGTFGADNTITRAEFTKIAIEAFNVSLEDGVFDAFSDIKSTDWFAKYVETAYENDIVKGYSNGTFKPHSPITRAEAMKVLMTSAGIDVSGATSAGFSDVPGDAWFAPYIDYANTLGVAGGYGDGTFGPGNNLRRGEVAKIVSLLLISDAGSAVSTALETSL